MPQSHSHSSSQRTQGAFKNAWKPQSGRSQSSSHRRTTHDNSNNSRKRSRDGDDDSDDEGKQKRVKEQRAAHDLRQKKLAESHQGLDKVSLKPADFRSALPFQKCFWPVDVDADGTLESIMFADGAVAVSEELKSLRKSLGVNVKGNLALCPPPIDAIDSANLPTSFAKVFKSAGLTIPSPIQRQAWPAILRGANLIALSPTGSGKTLAYGLPMIPHIESRLTPTSTHTGFSAHATKCKVFDVCAPIALVLVPTRELAMQVVSHLKPLSKASTTPASIRAVAVYGGQDKGDQVDAMTRGTGAAIVVATPGRMIDLLVSKSIHLSNVTYLVLDEMDRMMAAGFIEQITLISQQIRPDRQSLLFSATFPGKLREVANEWVSDPVSIRCSTMEFDAPLPPPAAPCSASTSVSDHINNKHADTDSGDPTHDKQHEHIISSGPGAVDTTADPTGTGAGTSFAEPSSSSATEQSSLTISDTIQQLVHVCATHKKPRLLIRYITRVREQEKTEHIRQPGTMLVFCTKIKTIKFVHDFLVRNGMGAAAGVFHGQMPQAAREKVLADFRAGKLSILCATDVAARGIHIKRLRYVVNYDFPSNLESYCHRVGRTGRQGETGFSYSLISRNLAPLTADLVALLKRCNQHVEPNLLALANEFASGTFELDPAEAAADEDSGEED